MSMDAAAGAETGLAVPEAESVAETDDEPPLSAYVDVLEGHADAVKRRELDRALARLAASDELSADQRDVVEAFGDAVVEMVLGDALRHLATAAETGDVATVEAGFELFVEE